MALEDNNSHESNEQFGEYKRMEQMKKDIAGNYATELEVAAVSGLFDILFACGPLPQRLMDKDLLEKLIAYLLPLIATTGYTRHELLLSAGHMAQYIYFCKRGFARGFFIEKKSRREMTHFLWGEHSIITVPNSFFHQQPSETFIEVTPGTELMSISFENLRACIKKYPVVAIFSRNVILGYNAYEMKRNYELSSLTAWERYIELLKTHPDIEQKVSKGVIASYLNITPQSLSRMLKERGHP
jgi:CRP/FNR family transcriptional regulator, anaerobic regulatory protein